MVDHLGSIIQKINVTRLVNYQSVGIVTENVDCLAYLICLMFVVHVLKCFLIEEISWLENSKKLEKPKSKQH